MPVLLEKVVLDAPFPNATPINCFIQKKKKIVSFFVGKPAIQVDCKRTISHIESTTWCVSEYPYIVDEYSCELVITHVFCLVRLFCVTGYEFCFDLTNLTNN